MDPNNQVKVGAGLGDTTDKNFYADDPEEESELTDPEEEETE